MRRGRQDNNKDHQKNGPSKPANNHQPVNNKKQQQQQQGARSNNSNAKSRTSPPPPQHHTASSSSAASKFKNNTTNNSQWSSNNNKPFSNFHQNQQQRQYSSASTNFNHPTHNNNSTTANDGNNPDPNFVVLKQTVMLVRDAQNQTWGLQIFDLTNGHQNQIHARNQTWIKYKIEEVDGHSPASYAGLRKNDVVVGVLEPAGLHSVFIRDFNDFGKYLSENNSIRLRIERTVPKEEENSAEHRIRLPCPTNSNDVVNTNGSQQQQQQQQHYSNTSPRKSSVGGLYVPGFAQQQQQNNSSSSQNVYDEIFGVAGEIGSNNIINNNEQPYNNQTQQQPTSVSAPTSNKPKVSTSTVKELGWFHKLLSHAAAIPSKSFLMGSSSAAVSSNVVSLPTRSSNDVESDRNFLEELMKEASV